ncbi:biotin--[acetyl-CoA-carboxylase] ligase [Leuconostoc palmae]|uniref:biotin--[acetyl-CoA-carboxylase] ligase n=1 Tax=Leuconostoc palmae TaxID=501487 RepID=UPI001C7D323C|nr:biotin--[acetyl-CoA-carboxylase] ligase [Leuconostoc palmae]
MTTTAEKLLNIFISNENQWVSGESLAHELSVTRAAVWKAINKLSDLGFKIESQRGLGYRYTANEKMSVKGIQHLLTSPLSIRVFDTLESTNKQGKIGLVSGDITEPTVIISNIQTHGVGHLGRTFFSPSQTGLYMSIALPVSVQTQVMPNLLTLGTAISVAKSIHNLFGKTIQFKWMNNLCLENKKIGGILTEGMISFETNTYSGIVVGIGLNLVPTHEISSTKINAITDKLTISRNQIAATIIQDFFDMYNDYKTGYFLTDYRQKLIGLGQFVSIQTPTGEISGTLSTVTNEGTLILETKDGTITFNNGEML